MVSTNYEQAFVMSHAAHDHGQEFVHYFQANKPPDNKAVDYPNRGANDMIEEIKIIEKFGNMKEKQDWPLTYFDPDLLLDEGACQRMNSTESTFSENEESPFS